MKQYTTMNKLHRMPRIATITLLLLLACIVGNGNALAQLTGRVIKVADGDTFTILTDSNKKVRVRLHGIDCPEMGQPYGDQAKAFTHRMVYGKRVSIRTTGTDKYYRTLGIVTVPDGPVLNELLLINGLAWHYKRYDKRTSWARMHTKAQRLRRGLWASNAPVQPSQWRQAHPRGKANYIDKIY